MEGQTPFYAIIIIFLILGLYWNISSLEKKVTKMLNAMVNLQIEHYAMDKKTNQAVVPEAEHDERG